MAWSKPHQLGTFTSQADKEILKKLLENPNIPYSQSLGWIAVHQAIESEQAEGIDLLFRRLNIVLGSETEERYAARQSEDIYETLGALPPSTMKPYIPQIAALAQNNSPKNHIRILFSELDKYDEAGLSILLDAFHRNIEARVQGVSNGNEDARSDEKATMKSVLGALSRLSEIGEPRLAEIYEGVKRVKASDNKYTSMDRSFIETLACYGASDEELVAVFLTSSTRSDYDKSIRKSAKGVRQNDMLCGRK